MENEIMKRWDPVQLKKILLQANNADTACLSKRGKSLGIFNPHLTRRSNIFAPVIAHRRQGFS